jgi:hypothetical protein
MNAYLDKVVDQDNRNEKNGDLESIKVESHVCRLSKTDPANDDHERQNEQRNLQTGADSNTNGEIHLVLDGDCDGSGVLCGVSDNREQDETDELLRDLAVCGDRIDGANHEFCAKCNQDCRASEGDEGTETGQLRHFLFLLFFVYQVLLVDATTGCGSGTGAHGSNTTHDVARFLPARLLLRHLLTRLVVHRGVGAQLEEKVASVGHKE